MDLEQSEGLNNYLKRELRKKKTFPNELIYNGLDESGDLDEVSFCIRVCGTSDYFVGNVRSSKGVVEVSTTNKREEARVFRNLNSAYQKALRLVMFSLKGIPVSIESI